MYDGQVWKDFLFYEGQPFLDLSYNFALLLNIDWFQHFDHTQHSEGVIYTVIMNLDRKHGFLQENCIIIGVIPGPVEPQGDINSFLEPLVDYLLLLWNGVTMNNLDGLPAIVISQHHVRHVDLLDTMRIVVVQNVCKCFQHIPLVRSLIIATSIGMNGSYVPMSNID